MVGGDVNIDIESPDESPSKIPLVSLGDWLIQVSYGFYIRSLSKEEFKKSYHITMNADIRECTNIEKTHTCRREYKESKYEFKSHIE